MKRRTQLPLDSLSSIVMIANAQPDDLIDVFGPFGKKYTVIKNNGQVQRRRVPLPALVDRLYCREHMLLALHRGLTNTKLTTLDWVETLLAQNSLELAVRQSLIRVFGVRRPSTKTWDQCPHCRWKERALERFRQ